MSGRIGARPGLRRLQRLLDAGREPGDSRPAACRPARRWRPRLPAGSPSAPLRPWSARWADRGWRDSPVTAKAFSLPFCKCCITEELRGDEDLHLAGEHVLDCLAGAAVRDVDHAGAGAQLEHLGADVGQRTIALRGVAQSAGVLFQVGNELLQRIGRHRGIHRDHVGGDRDPPCASARLADSRAQAARAAPRRMGCSGRVSPLSFGSGTDTTRPEARDLFFASGIQLAHLPHRCPGRGPVRCDAGHFACAKLGHDACLAP